MLRAILPACGLLLLVAAKAVGAQTIGFAQVGSESNFRRTFTADMKDVAAKRGLTLLFADADNNPQRQLEEVRGFIAAHVDAIVLAPVVETGWTELLQQAQAANIPVFLAGRTVEADPALFVARIAADYNLEGRLAGAWLAQASRGACNILELRGTEGAAPTIERHRGFLAVVSLFPRMRIVRSESGDFTPEGGARAMRDFLRADPDLKDICAVWAHNDEMILGAIAAMKEAGLHPGHDQLMISVDGAPGIFRAMLAGEANMSVEQKPDIGRDIFDVVQGYLAGRRDIPKWVLIASDLHTPADAAAMLARRGS
jgi:simple sugar transport system substrate-binding protein